MLKRNSPSDPNQMSVSLAAQLFLTHFVTAALAIYLAGQLPTGLNPLGWLTLALAAAAVLGLLLTSNLQRSIRALHWALIYLTHSEPIPPLSGSGHGPLAGLMAHLATLAERERPFADLRQAQLQQTSADAAREERHRLARELHDSIKQQIFSIHISAAAIEARWEKDVTGARNALTDIRQSAQAALVEMNALLQQLRPAPLAQVGLVEALQEQCAALGYRTGAEVKLDVKNLPADDRFPLGAQETLFRLAQEALSNIARHARANNVTLAIYPHQNQKRLIVSITDDGQGFTTQPPPKGMGLANMRRRIVELNGRFNLTSAPEQGTTIELSIPLTTVLSTEEKIMQKTNPTLNRIGLVAIVGGIALMAVLYYPLYILVPGQYLTEWPQGSPILGNLLYFVALLLTVGIGYIAAREGKSSDPTRKTTIGAIAGGVAALIMFYGLGGAAAGVIGHEAILNHGFIPTDSEGEFLHILTNAVNNTLWWTYIAFLGTGLGGVILGAIGGRLAPAPATETDWSHLYPAQYLITLTATISTAFMYMMATIIYALLGPNLAQAAETAAAAGYQLDLPAWGANVWPALAPLLAYLVCMSVGLYQLYLRRTETNVRELRTSLFYTCFFLGVGVLIPSLSLLYPPQYDGYPTAYYIIGVPGVILNLGLVLLFIHVVKQLWAQIEAGSEERFSPRIKQLHQLLPIAAIIGALISFLNIPLLTFGVALVIVILIAWLWSLQHQSGRHYPNAYMIPRTLEAKTGTLLALGLPTMAFFPSALSLVLISIESITVIINSDAAGVGPVAADTTLEALVRTLYTALGMSELLTFVVAAIFLGLALIISRITLSRYLKQRAEDEVVN